MEPWEVRPNDIRIEDSKKVFIIFCEDGAVEPAYFELFKSEHVHISIQGNTKQHHAQVDLATEYFRKSGLLESVLVNGEVREVLSLEEGAQVWCVFDRDKEEGDSKDTAFNDSISAARAKGIRTAWSNDDFELWILLHFEDVNILDPSYLHRTKYYERLTEILKTHFPEESQFQHPKFDYYSSMKTKKKFLAYTYQIMKGNRSIAMERARNLESLHNSTPSKPPHLRCPCTLVHHLVKELITL